MMLGILLLWSYAGTFNFRELQARLPGLIGGHTLPLTLIGALIFCGAVGKSAQFPLHVWLPDAMEGPTPVSALIHAATMVAAGVYMLCRVFFVIAPSGTVLTLIAWIGGITAIMAATIAVAQNDIKRILAYSTLSQLGYMVMAVGLGGPTAAMFHLTTHAFFKALLFLGAGSVILALHHEQEDADYVLDVSRRHAGVGGRVPVQRFLQQGRDSVAGDAQEHAAVHHGHGDGLPDGVLHGPGMFRRVLR